MILKIKNIILYTCLFFLLNGCSSGKLYNHVEYLASNELEGRYPGTSGGLAAAEYIRYEFKRSNIDLMLNDGFQDFDFISGVKLGENNLFTFNNDLFIVEKDFMPLSFGGKSSLNASIFVAGYGFEIDQDSLFWNDYAAYDISGKWVMIFRGSPSGNNPHDKYNDYTSLRKKALVAKDNSAAGVIFVTGEQFDLKDNLIKLSYEQSQQDIGIPIINITRDVADILLKSSEKTVSLLEKELNSNLSDFDSFFIDEFVNVTTDVYYEKKNTQNVVGIIHGQDNILKNEYIVIGAHYDHIGYGGNNSSSRRPYLNEVHNGADDNASGVSILIELVNSIKNINPKRSVVFVGFGAEEMGLLGSKYFVDSRIIPEDKIHIMINMDMVGRLNKNEVLSISGTKTAGVLEDVLNDVLNSSSLKHTFSASGYGPSDHSSFYVKDIPVLFFFTGAHTDYHTPYDDINTLNYKGMKKIEKFIFSLVKELDDIEKLQFSKTEDKKESRPSKFKVTLGIMPDYVFKDVKGLRVDIVIPDKPAYKGGLKDGDIIIRIDDKPVGDIYEYMHRLSELSPGQKAIVVVLRNNEKMEFEVTF